MNFYRLYPIELDNYKDKAIICEGDNDSKMYEYTFNLAKRYDGWNGNFKILYDIKDVKKGKRFTDSLLTNMAWFVVSEKFKTILEGLNTEIQFLPVEVCEKNNKGPTYTYYIANILTVVDALCLDISEYFVTNIKIHDNERQIYNFSKHGIYKSKTNGKDLFKLLEVNTVTLTPIFISEKAKKIIEQNKITEVSFARLSTRE